MKELGRLDLKLVDYYLGRSAINLIFQQKFTSKKYDMSFMEFFRLVKEGDIIDGKITGWFVEKKRGTAVHIYCEIADNVKSVTTEYRESNN